MEPAKRFEDLVAWQKAHQFVIGVYQYTKNFPKDEIFGLRSQFRRAAVSIAANIVEGFKKRGIKDKCKFLNIAQASLEECRYYLLLSRDLNFGENEILNSAAAEVGRILDKYYNTIAKSKK